jgi:dihydroflavonol-4-reductase
VVIVNPSYVFGVPVDRSEPGETSTRTIGNYLLGRLPGVVDAAVNVVDVRDMAAGHLAAAERGRPGERYVLGGRDIGWAGLIERLARISGVQHPIAVLPRETARAARMEALRLPLPITSEALVLMAQNWRYSSTKARRELGYRVRRLDTTLGETVRWYQELIDSGTLRSARRSPLSLAASGPRLADRTGVLSSVRAAERYVGRRLGVGA